METRMYGEVKEHKHPETGHDYWHPAVRRHVPRDNTIKSISICVSHEDGNVEEREIDLNQAFIFDVTQAVKNGKDPVEAMILLLNIGSEHLALGEHKNAREHVIEADGIHKEDAEMTNANKVFDVYGREIHVGDRVRFAVWGMFDIFVSDKENSGRKDTDPKYVTHVRLGTVDEILEEVGEGSIHVRPDGVNGVWHLTTKPSWGARPEFVEVI